MAKRLRRLQLVKKGFDKLVDGEARSPARCRASNLRFEPSAVSPKAKPENPKGFQPPCHPHQSPLKIEDFSGAEPARKRFLLRKMGFSGAKIAPCPRCAFALPILWRGGSKWSRALPGRKGCGPLELSGGFLTVWPPLKGEVPAVRAVGFETEDPSRSDLWRLGSCSVRRKQVGVGTADRRQQVGVGTADRRQQVVPGTARSESQPPQRSPRFHHPAWPME